VTPPALTTTPGGGDDEDGSKKTIVVPPVGEDPQGPQGSQGSGNEPNLPEDLPPPSLPRFDVYESGPDINGVLWVREPGPAGELHLVPAYDSLPQNVELVPLENGELAVFVTDPDVIAAAIEAGLGQYGIFDEETGKMIGLYVGGYEPGLDGELMFIPNSSIPLGLLTGNNRGSMPWWLLLFVPFIVFLAYRRKLLVTFVSNVDKEPYHQFIRRGDKIVCPEVFKIEGRSVAGWYTTEVFEDKSLWNFDEHKVNKRIVLYARWKADSHKAKAVAAATPLRDEQSDAVDQLLGGLDGTSGLLAPKLGLGLAPSPGAGGK
jgi:hypothetical protein